jgi:hypothetical protein
MRKKDIILRILLIADQIPNFCWLGDLFVTYLFFVVEPVRHRIQIDGPDASNLLHQTRCMTYDQLQYLYY